MGYIFLYLMQGQNAHEVFYTGQSFEFLVLCLHQSEYLQGLLHDADVCSGKERVYVRMKLLNKLF